MQLKKNYARRSTHGTAPIAHMILEDEVGNQYLLCNPNGKFQPGILTEHPREYFLRECDRCKEAVVPIVTARIAGNKK